MRSKLILHPRKSKAMSGKSIEACSAGISSLPRCMHMHRSKSSAASTEASCIMRAHRWLLSYESRLIMKFVSGLALQMCSLLLHSKMCSGKQRMSFFLCVCMALLWRSNLLAHSKVSILSSFFFFYVLLNIYFLFIFENVFHREEVEEVLPLFLLPSSRRSEFHSSQC